jgi:hypothetical protein
MTQLNMSAEAKKNNKNNYSDPDDEQDDTFHGTEATDAQVKIISQYYLKVLKLQSEVLRATADSLIVDRKGKTVNGVVIALEKVLKPPQGLYTGQNYMRGGTLSSLEPCDITAFKETPTCNTILKRAAEYLNNSEAVKEYKYYHPHKQLAVKVVGGLGVAGVTLVTGGVFASAAKAARKAYKNKQQPEKPGSMAAQVHQALGY